MKVPTNYGAKFEIGAIRKGGISHSFGIKNRWDWSQWRKDENGIYRMIDSWSHGNLVTNEGLDAALDIMFHASTQISTWYIFPFENDYTPLATNTYASPGCTECQAYDEANRQEFNEAAASSQSINNNANQATFTMNATKTLYGGCLVSDNTKGDTAASGAILFCSGTFAASKAFESADIAEIKLTITASDQ